MKKRMAVSVLGLLFLWSNVALSQDKVVVIPLGSDVSAKQFNDLVDQVNQSQVFSGFVESNGAKGGFGHYLSSRVSEGIYDVTVIPPFEQIEITHLTQPSIVVTSKDVFRIANISILDLLNDRIRFRVTLSARDGTIADADFYFHVQFSEFSSGVDGPSDLRLKTNVKKLGETSEGLNLYQFNYINDPSKTSYIGVMAQDILLTHPHAVRKAEDGYYRVNYFKLGLRMSTLKNWNKFGLSAVEMKYGVNHF